MDSKDVSKKNLKIVDNFGFNEKCSTVLPLSPRNKIQINILFVNFNFMRGGGQIRKKFRQRKFRGGDEGRENFD